MTRPLIIGVGQGGVDSLPAEIRERLAETDLIIAAPRFHAGLPDGPEIQDWPTPFSNIYNILEINSKKSIALLATGDPLWFGAGASLVRKLGPDACDVVPAVSGLQLAAARLGWPMAECRVISIHGRPVGTLAAALSPRAKLLVIAQDGTSPRQVARLLSARGYGAAEMHVLVDLGGADEERIDGIAGDWQHDRVHDFHIIGISCPDAGPVLPGLAAPDSSFDNDGKLTKRDVRASALAKLAPFPGAVLWDVGSGSGAVSVDFLRNAPRGRAFAIDRSEGQMARASANAEAHGVAGFHPVVGDAGAAIGDLPVPDAVFLGGGLSEPVISAAQTVLRPGGVLVAHAVTIESESVLVAAWQRTGGDLTRLSVQHADPVGGFHGWRPLMPVTQWCWHKRA